MLNKTKYVHLFWSHVHLVDLKIDCSMQMIRYYFLTNFTELVCAMLNCAYSWHAINSLILNKLCLWTVAKKSGFNHYLCGGEGCGRTIRVTDLKPSTPHRMGTSPCWVPFMRTFRCGGFPAYCGAPVVLPSHKPGAFFH